MSAAPQTQNPRSAEPRAESEKTFDAEGQYNGLSPEVNLNAAVVECSPSSENSLAFLTAVLPTASYYCVSTNDPGKTGSWRDYPVTSLEDLETKARNASTAGLNVYYALSGYGQAAVNVQNPDGTVTRRFRTKDNAVAQKALWLDIDVGKPNSKYSNVHEAIQALFDFVKATGLPSPTVVFSGHGLHVYWIFADQIATAHWHRMASQLKLLAKQMAFDVDHARTTDAASVLRVPGTKNYGKDAIPPDVALLQLLPPCPVEELEEILSQASMQTALKNISPPAPDTQLTAIAGHSCIHLYVQKALDEECAKLAATPEGDRNIALNKASFVLATLVGGGVLDEGLARSRLMDAALQCGLLDDDEAAKTVRTIESGITSGKLYPRGIPASPPATSQASEESIASAFTVHHAETLCFCADWGCWLEWNPVKHIWEQDKTNKVFDYARRECKLLNPKNKSSLGKSATAQGVERFARADPLHATTGEHWDQHPFVLGTPDGAINLEI